MINRFRKILAPPVFEGNEELTYDARVINTLLWMSTSFTVIALISRIFIQTSSQPASIILNIIQLAVWGSLLVLLKRGQVTLSGDLLLGAIFITLNLQAYISGGLHRPIIFVNLIAVALAALFSNRRVVLFAAMSIVAAIIMYFLDGVLLPAPTTALPLTSILIVFSLITLFTGFILQFAANNLRNALVRARANEQELVKRNRELQNYQQSLEEQVEERTAELASRGFELEKALSQIQRRSAQFEALAQVAQSISSIRDPQELLPRITSVVSEFYGFYHVGIFLVDQLNEFAVLQAANSEGGQRMLARNHRLRVGEEGIVGKVTSTGEPLIALDVGTNAVYFGNPDLPDTHSEMGLPLRSGGKIIGVLDVQSMEIGAFSNDDIQTLSLLADQVSLAIENARLFENSNRTLSELQMVMRQSTREAWKRLPEQQELLGFRYNAMGASPLKEPVRLAETGKGKAKAKGTTSTAFVVPIELRGEVIGNLVVQSPAGATWNADQQDIIRAVAERVALSAENARLFEETTQRAERERLVTDITGKIRSHNDPQAMIETAINELRSALGASRVQIIPKKAEDATRKDSQV